MRRKRDKQHTNDDLLLQALDMVGALIDKAGANRIAVVTATPDRICLQPRNLLDGEAIARLLGCDQALDHRLLTPGYTLWTGMHSGLEIQVRSVLRGLTGGIR
ncbi:hypothetical protein GCM10027059_11450 [Myceligenerans halotolerans]